LLHDVEHLLPPRRVEHRVIERHREHLIWPTFGAVSVLAVDDVVQIPLVGYPETLIE
jgi:hypothetical protein